MKPAIRRWYGNSVVVERGPILFSLPIETEWQKLRTCGMTADWEARPRSAWNYGLPNQGDVQLSETKHSANRGQSIFSLEGTPVKSEVQGRKIPRWRAENGVAGELPSGPVLSDQPAEKLALVPYGAAKLRITVFPMVQAVTSVAGS